MHARAERDVFSRSPPIVGERFGGGYVHVLSSRGSSNLTMTFAAPRDNILMEGGKGGANGNYCRCETRKQNAD